MKPLVIYHYNCADGFGAAFAAWLKLGDEAEYLPMQYGNIDVDLECVDREVYILDFSFPKVMMDNIFHAAKRVVWLDHHKTAFEMWLKDDRDFPVNEFLTDPHKSFHVYGSKKFIVLNNWKSGAMLAWECFHPDKKVPLFIKHIDDYDRWQFKIEGTKAFNKALLSYAPWSFKQWVEWFYDCEANFNHAYWSDDFYTGGAAILRAHDQNVASVVKDSARACGIPPTVKLTEMYAPGTVFEPLQGLVANCPPHLTSDVGHELAIQSGTFGLCWTLNKEGFVAQCSLRSNGDYDVSAIAKAFGGGGHRNAAGFEVPIQTLLGWLK